MKNDAETLFDISQLWNCDHAFSFQCPREWSSLTKTGISGIRQCQACGEDVTLCKTVDQFVELGNAGKCVAIPDGVGPSTMNMMMLGRPSPAEVERLNQRKRRCSEWWAQAIDAAPTFAPNAFRLIKEQLNEHPET